MKSKPNTDAIELSGYISAFVEDYAPKHLTESPNTLRSYESALTLYIGFLEEKCGITSKNFSKDCFDQQHIEEWLDWLVNERNCSINTRNNRLSALRTFTEFLSSRSIKYLDVKTASKAVPYKTTKKNKVEGLTREAVKALLAEPNPKSHYGLRDLTLMTVLYGTAARIGELLSITIGDLQINQPKPYVTIIGKGGSPRTLYLLPRAVDYIKLYIEEFHGSEPDGGSVLFFSPIKGRDVSLSQQAVSDMLHKYAARAHEKCDDVPLSLHAHQLRHAKATHWLEDGMNIAQISRLLGHSSVETTMIYLDITPEQELEALSTIEFEKQRNVQPKWNKKTDTLAGLCGLRNLKK